MDYPDYTNWNLEELLAEEKKIKEREYLAAGLIGFLIGVFIYGTVKKGIGFLHMFLPLLLIAGIIKGSQKQKEHLRQIQAAIRAKNTG